MRNILALVGFTVVHVVAAQSQQGSVEQPTITAPHKNPWATLSDEESASVEALLQQRLNLTGNQGNIQDSYVFQINLLAPNKSDIIPFLDSNSTQLSRHARATIVFGASDSWQEYLVGPLPATNSTKAIPLTYPFHNSQPGNTKVHPLYYTADAVQFQTQFGTDIEDITKELWNTTFAEGGLALRLGTPFWEEDGRVIAWAALVSTPQSEISSPTVLALGVTVKFDLTGREWGGWKAVGWYSRGQYYDSTEEFRDAVFSAGFDKPPPSVDGEWASTDKHGAPLPLDDLSPPISVAQEKQRFQLDAAENYISWMDFSFFFSTSKDLGLSLFDIQYKGKRLFYELSLQEALSHYAGSDPFASQATFLDTGGGMGTTLATLVRGYDCPLHATYLNATFSEGTASRTQADAICIFEYDAGYPIRRHFFPPTYTSVAKNIVFTIRTVATVGNYDFLIEYNFFYDGAIEVSARASGYISAAYWENNPEYGFHIHDYLSGSLHDHVLMFKADLDILGDKNSLQKVEFTPISVEYPWSKGRVHNTMKATRGFISDESDSSVKWADNDAAIYAIVNKNTPNRFGEFPGYRFKRSAGTSHLTVKNSTNVPKAANFATHDFYITKQKDTEPRATDPNNQFAPEDPLVDFSRFLDGESIDQEDIVLWFNLGMHHMPHTGDLPNTMFTAAHTAVRFEPLNYLEGDPSVASNQQVRVTYNEDGTEAGREEFGKVTS
ncbi:amine oxidase catalytic domain-containing protein [Aaosphaeria arxii CBS 175.79]|uniref:Amine oxidase n=1 Tax=Aaosphaeria arxii CBS 175.79 TaxID=1450172 RepID=A0A6A5YCP0_9PLEO|nr:amine oxidase catalytic domain-containing protein [Aaosphaeria arxii CBS 175.79]KAF2022351.1 amine oxidase catalytic domain-containing protein [Aaosphaeria arxii CBS 175.79]